jgi:hypothetical protein
MSNNAATYSPNQILLTIGNYAITGYAPNTFIEVEQSSKSFEIVKGMRGVNARKRNLDKSLRITFRLLQTHDTNNILTQIHQADLDSGAGRFAINLTDLASSEAGNGKGQIISNKAFIEGFPNIVYSGSLEAREWTIICLDYETYRVAGNSSPTLSLFGLEFS